MDKLIGLALVLALIFVIITGGAYALDCDPDGVSEVPPACTYDGSRIPSHGIGGIQGWWHYVTVQFFGANP